MIWRGLEQDRYWTGRETEGLAAKEIQEWIKEKLGRKEQQQ
jgi:hypothetical protein